MLKTSKTIEFKSTGCVGPNDENVFKNDDERWKEEERVFYISNFLWIYAYRCQWLHFNDIKTILTKMQLNKLTQMYI